MRVAVVAGPDPGHAFPALALCLRFLAAGDAPTLLTGTEWLDTARVGRRGRRRTRRARSRPKSTTTPTPAPRFTSAPRGWRCSTCRVLRDLAPDLVVSDVITACGGLAAELLGMPWVELNPAPAVPAVEGPAAARQRAGAGCRGSRQAARRGHAGADRAVVARGHPPALGRPRRDRSARSRSRAAAHGSIATLPALEVPRPDWPAEAVVVGPLHFEPTDAVLDDSAGRRPRRRRRAVDGDDGRAWADRAGAGGAAAGGRRCRRARGWWCRGWADPTSTVPPWAVVGLGRQDELLSHADLVICGGGHGIVSKTLLAGVPMVVVPGGGDQWEIANRVVRQGSAQLVRPLTADGAGGRGAARCWPRRAYCRGRQTGGRQPSPTSPIRYGCAMKRSAPSA